jgi:hypothetical protein
MKRSISSNMVHAGSRNRNRMLRMTLVGSTELYAIATAVDVDWKNFKT